MLTAQASAVRYRDMGEHDLPYVAAEHARHFPDGFFARLGHRFLVEYYRGFLTGPTAVSLLAEAHGHPVGYLVGVVDPVAHREHVLQHHGRSLALRAVAALTFRPRLAARFLRTRLVRYARRLLARRHSTPSPSSAPELRTAVLSRVAVADHAQSLGVGSELIRRFRQQVVAAGCERITLVTASGENGAGPYYRRRGWWAVGEHATPDGLRLTTYELVLDASAHRVSRRERTERAG